MKIAAFLSHPIQHFTPLWQELSKRDGVELKVFYYSEQGVRPSMDREFGLSIVWDVDFLAGHNYEFLPRQWPTSSSLDYSWKGLNKNIYRSLKENWDVVYIAGYSHLNNWWVLRCCRKLGTPVLCQGDSNILNESCKNPVLLMFKRLVINNFLRRLSGCLAIGNNNYDYCIHYGAKPENMFFCPIPVDIERFRSDVEKASEEEKSNLRTKYDLPMNKRVITFSGKLVLRKRPLDLVRAVEKIDRDDIVCLFIGDGPLRSEIEKINSDKIRIAGFVNQSKIPLLTSLGAILVMPSSYDPHPLSVTESLCLGIPVILSDMCGCYGPDDVFRDGENGLLYRCGNVDDLAEKINYMLDKQDVYDIMSRRAKELAETQSPQQAADCFLKAAEQVCARRTDRKGG